MCRASSYLLKHLEMQEQKYFLQYIRIKFEKVKNDKCHPPFLNYTLIQE